MPEEEENPSPIWAVIAVIIAVSLFFVHKNITENHQKLKASGSEAVGTISDIDTKFLNCEYSFDGNSHTSAQPVPFRYLVDGEQYMIKYFPDDPKNIAIDFGRPVLSSGTTYDEVKPDELRDLDYLVEFTYTVDGVEYTRIRKVNNQALRMAELCIVKYQRDNPQIGYLMLASSNKRELEDN